jgi:hypothetical protein
MSANCSFYLLFRPSESEPQRNLFLFHDRGRKWGPIQRTACYHVFFVSWITGDWGGRGERKYSIGEGDSQIMIGLQKPIILWLHSASNLFPDGSTVSDIASVEDFKQNPMKLNCISIELNDTDYGFLFGEFENARSRNVDLEVRITLCERENIENPVMVREISTHISAQFWP